MLFLHVQASLFKDDLEEAYAAVEMFKTRYDISANAYTYVQFINAFGVSLGSCLPSSQRIQRGEATWANALSNWTP